MNKRSRPKVPVDWPLCRTHDTLIHSLNSAQPYYSLPVCTIWYPSSSCRRKWPRWFDWIEVASGALWSISGLLCWCWSCQTNRHSFYFWQLQRPRTKWRRWPLQLIGQLADWPEEHLRRWPCCRPNWLYGPCYWLDVSVTRLTSTIWSTMIQCWSDPDDYCDPVGGLCRISARKCKASTASVRKSWLQQLSPAKATT